MNTPTKPLQRPLGEAMVEDHDRIETLLDRILVDEPSCDESRQTKLWLECAALIRDHLEIEDVFLLPAFELAEPDIGRALRADHARIRLLCGNIGVAIDLQTERELSIMTLSRLLRGHHRREAMAMQQWARGMRVAAECSPHRNLCAQRAGSKDQT